MKILRWIRHMICLLGTHSWRNWINKQIILLKYAEGRPQGHMAFKQNLGGKSRIFQVEKRGNPEVLCRGDPRQSVIIMKQHDTCRKLETINIEFQVVGRGKGISLLGRSQRSLMQHQLRNVPACHPEEEKIIWTGDDKFWAWFDLLFCFNIIILWDEMNGWEKDIYERTITEIAQEHVSPNFECSAGHVKIKWIHDMTPLWKQPNALWMSVLPLSSPCVAESIRSFKGLEHSYF